MGIQVYASVHYTNSAAALDWLADNLGFKKLFVVYGPEGPHGKSVQVSWPMKSRRRCV